MLAVTFTNKAAREMRERVGAILGRPVEGLWLGTFHALCARMLRRHAELVGLTANFTILDTDDQLRLLKQVMEAERIDTKRWAPPALMAVIQRWKDRGLTPARVTPARGHRLRRRPGARALRRLPGAAACAERRGFRRPAAAHDGDPARASRTSWRSITACSATSWWTNTRTPTWCSISGCGCWRRRTATSAASATTTSRSIPGAAPRWRTSCASRRTFQGAKIVRLEANYRSTAPILAAASALIAHNEGRLGKTLRPGGRTRDGERVTVVGLWDSDEEARMVGDRIETLRRDGEPLAEMAILVRAGFQTRAFEERLITLGVPYRVVGGLRFYERQEIRDAIAYMRAGGAAGGRPGVRAHRQRAAARRGRGGAARHARDGARATACR